MVFRRLCSGSAACGVGDSGGGLGGAAGAAARVLLPPRSFVYRPCPPGLARATVGGDHGGWERLPVVLPVSS
ncbi:hypothetical protein U9M48_021048 [Paspalum notatum var. saurae]|uniref:Uncharacterized protein n=1 Tax=Paspalum notatum var. saurae TaxID=547442 RepID=A0AAQ3TGI7_PASNO